MVGLLGIGELPSGARPLSAPALATPLQLTRNLPCVYFSLACARGRGGIRGGRILGKVRRAHRHNSSDESTREAPPAGSCSLPEKDGDLDSSYGRRGPQLCCGVPAPSRASARQVRKFRLARP